MEALKNNILLLMSAQNLTAYGITKKSNLKIATIQNILYGKSKNPTIGVLKELAKALNCSVADLIDDTQTVREFLDDQWDARLYFSIVSYLGEIFSERNKNLSYKEIQKIIKEVYEYSFQNNSKKADKAFCRWILDKEI